MLCAGPQAAWRIPGQYLVILDAGSHESHVQRTINRLTAKAARRGYLLEILKTYTGVLHGFLVKMSSDVLHMVRGDLPSCCCADLSNMQWINVEPFSLTMEINICLLPKK